MIFFSFGNATKTSVTKKKQKEELDLGLYQNCKLLWPRNFIKSEQTTYTTEDTWKSYKGLVSRVYKQLPKHDKHSKKRNQQSEQVFGKVCQHTTRYTCIPYQLLVWILATPYAIQLIDYASWRQWILLQLPGIRPPTWKVGLVLGRPR